MTMLLLDITLSFFISLLAGMGVGGGGLLVIYLSLARQMPQLEAQGINLLFFISASLSALIINLKKRQINLSSLLIFSLTGSIFAIIGAIIASYVDASLLKRIFGGLLIISGITAFIKK
ncbi:MAG: TSUP family transporter [Clostridia bacterium]|nr:TSUP family transporter [Clostridia bacterium]